MTITVLLKRKKGKIIVFASATCLWYGWFISQAEWIYRASVMWSLACFGIRGKAINQTKWNHRGNKPLIFTYFTFTDWVTFLDYKRELVAVLSSPTLLFKSAVPFTTTSKKNLLCMAEKNEWIYMMVEFLCFLSVRLEFTLYMSYPSIICHIERIKKKKKQTLNSWYDGGWLFYLFCHAAAG